MTIECAQQLIEKIILPKEEKNVYRIYYYKTSKLDPFRYEILMLHNEFHCSLGEIQQWLEMKHNISITTIAIWHRINHWKAILSRKEKHDQIK